MRLVAAEPGPGLVPAPARSSTDIPNNHLSYAIQWFLFAAAARSSTFSRCEARARGDRPMSANSHRLANGVTVASTRWPARSRPRSALYAAVGSRSEPDGKAASRTWSNIWCSRARAGAARAIAEAIEDVGGSLNAWTARDQTVFHARTLSRRRARLELIADLVRAPRIDPEELEREKLVILSELGECLDAPDDLIHDFLFEAAYGDQPVARPVLGREASINALTRADCTAWLAEQYRPDRLVISAAGKVDRGSLLNLAEALRRPGAGRSRRLAPASFAGGIRSDRRSAEQTHLAFAYPGLASSDPAASGAGPVHAGGRRRHVVALVPDLREDRGLAYSIYAWTQGFAETGLFGVNLSTDSAAPPRPWRWHATASPRPPRLERGRTQPCPRPGRGRTADDAGNAAGHAPISIARSIEIFGRIMSLDEMLGELRDVDVAAARASGRALLGGPRARGGGRAGGELRRLSLSASRQSLPSRGPTGA